MQNLKLIKALDAVAEAAVLKRLVGSLQNLDDVQAGNSVSAGTVSGLNAFDQVV